MAVGGNNPMSLMGEKADRLAFEMSRFEQSISEGSVGGGPSVAPTVQPHPHWVPPSAVHAAKPQKPAKPPSQATLLKNAIAAHMDKNSVQTMASEAMMRVKQDLKFRRKTVAPDKAKLRCAGGQVWYDPSLEDWDPNDFRIFCGDLGNDVTDEVLARAFSHFPTFMKAKVIRDKHTHKTKGFGFVSFKDPHDFINAMKEVNGKYIGSRPVKLRKSTWRDRNIDIVKKREKEKRKLGLK